MGRTKARRVLRLRLLRKSRDWTLDVMAKRAKLSRGTYHKIESGKQDPSLPQAEAIASVFGRPIEEVFQRVEVSP